MGLKDQPPTVSSEAQVAAQTALQKLDHLSAQAALYGLTPDGIELLASLTPPEPDESPEICLDEEALAALSPRERFAFAFATEWARDFDENFGLGCQLPPKVLSQSSKENLGLFMVSLARAVQGILRPTGAFGSSVVENMIQTNESYRTFINRANQLLTKA